MSEDCCFLQPSARPGSLGRLGHYEALEVLGQGGFGIVFRAFDEQLQRQVAIKVLAPELAAASAAHERFLREARSSARVRHENVVQTYAVEEEPLPYLVMELVPGETLQQRLGRAGALEVAEVVRLGRQIAEGLAAAHGTGLIHRDVKPSNILLEAGPNPHARITDFGLACAVDDPGQSQAGAIAGTPLYVSPEQASACSLDQRSDLFSLGSVLYVMCTGQPPFQASSTLAVLERVVEDTPRPIRDIVPEVPRWLCDVIAKLHAKKPEDRFQSAREVADVLAQCEALLDANASAQDLARFPQSKSATGRSSRWKWLAATVLLLAVLALALTEVAGVTHLFRGQQQGADTTRAGTDTTRVGIAPFSDADVKRIAALPAADQLEEVRKELMRRNPGFDGEVQSKVEEGVVSEVWVVTDKVKDVSPLRVLNALRVLSLRGTGTGGRENGGLADLTPLKGMDLSGLRILGLTRTHVGDADLALFKDCKGLTEVYLSGTRVSDAGLTYFNDCLDLEFLKLDDTQVTDAGLARLADWKNLVALRLDGTLVSDAGLAHLKDCKNLKSLSVQRTKVTAAGIDALKEALPKCRVLWAR